MQLKIYQENAIDDLLTKTKKLLGYAGNKKLVFKSPTGSGKTVMVAEFLKQLVEDREIRGSLCFIWAAPRQLHTQSYDKLEKYFETSRMLKCSYFEELDNRKISENEILFFNWESINKKDNIYIRESEQEFNLSKVLERTREEKRKIILIIDESHYSAGARDQKDEQSANRLRQEINADLTVEVSATPIFKDTDETVTVQIEDVKQSGMIKKAVVLNSDFDNFIENQKIKTQKLSGSSEELVIDAAVQKRQELLEAYKKEGASINPLILIQLPDRTGELEDRVRERVESILKSKYKISTEKENNKLAIWLSGEHINKEEIEKPDNEVEVLIFKQAPALGWDCPRAQILILFREWHSPIFSIQTVGRIMRMPEPDKGHYETEILNYGYAYTNLDTVEIKEDIARNYITIHSSKKISNYSPINLPSFYSKRHREKTRLSPFFTEVFLKCAEEYGLRNKIDIKNRKVNLKIISDFKAEDIDVLPGIKIEGNKEIKIDEVDLQKIFDYFVRSNLSPFYPEDRSVGRVKESIYEFFRQEFQIEFGEGQDIVLSDRNVQDFISVLDKTKENYQKETIKRETELETKTNWNVPDVLFFNENYTREDRKKSVLQPFYSDQRWSTEKAFIGFLENEDNNLEWWFKNGDQDATFFAVPYRDGEEKPFYVDFIIKLKDGRIGLFDTHGTFLSDFGPKADGLYKYIQDQSKKGKNLFGGMVINTDPKNYRGRWIYFDKTKTELKKDNFKNWKDLTL